MQNERLQRLTIEYGKLWKRRGTIAYKTFITPDDLQDAFVHILANKMDKFENESFGQAYIYMVAKSKASKRIKKLTPLYVDTFELREESQDGFDTILENDYQSKFKSFMNKQSLEDRQILIKIMDSDWNKASRELGMGRMKLRYRYLDKINELKRLINGHDN
jgi:cold shock CspA family protein